MTMQKQNSFGASVIKIAVPVALQCMLQASFSIVDQVMVGTIGSVSVAAVGFASKLSSLYGVVIGAVVSVAGILMAQYLGADDAQEADRSFSWNLLIAMLIAALFTAVCLAFPTPLMRLYSKDDATVLVASSYLRIVCIGFLGYAANLLIATRMRCYEHATLPLLFSIAANILNTLLNALLIFGKLGFPAMGANGAAIASVVSQLFNTLLLVIGMLVTDRKRNARFVFSLSLRKLNLRTYGSIFLPVLVIEFMWSLSENVYASIYGHIGTLESAAMTLTYPIQGLMIGAMSGLAQAAGILIGKELGSKAYDSAYRKAKKLMCYGLAGSVILSAALVLLMRFYVEVYQVEPYVKQTAMQLLTVFALVSPVKVLNMILGGGIVKSGGKTRIMMGIELLGAWGFGVPLGLLGAYVWHLEIPYVYLILSMEECVRLLLTWIVFVRKKWMQTI